MICKCLICDVEVLERHVLRRTITLRNEEDSTWQAGDPPREVACRLFACPSCRAVVAKPDGDGEHFNIQALNARGELEFVYA